jgi:diguanylate cyclase (GGDEF)-like protein
VLLPETDLAAAKALADRLCTQVAAADIAGTRVTVSIGVAAAALAMSGFDALMQAADAALYAAKRNGRGNAQCAMRSAEPDVAAE